MSERVILSVDEAVAMLPDGDTIHTFGADVPGKSATLIGADWTRDEVLAHLKRYTPELSGPIATGMGHGIVTRDIAGHLFIETRQEEQS